MSTRVESSHRGVTAAAASLLRALERQHGHGIYSLNVRDAMGDLYAALRREIDVDPDDAYQGGEE